MIQTSNKYDVQADDFLKECGVMFFAEKAVPQQSPLWAKKGEDHGTTWNITLVKLRSKYTDQQYTPTSLRDITGNIDKQRSFFFWSSIASKKEARSGVEKKPRAYDVLASISYDTSAGLKDFCDNLGFDEESKNAQKVFDATVELNVKLSDIFTSSELEKLAEIQ